MASQPLDIGGDGEADQHQSFEHLDEVGWDPQRARHHLAANSQEGEEIGEGDDPETIQPGQIDQGEGGKPVPGFQLPWKSPFTPRMSFAPASPARAPLASSADQRQPVDRHAGMDGGLAVPTQARRA